jgi:hypothetical protein
MFPETFRKDIRQVTVLMWFWKNKSDDVIKEYANPLQRYKYANDIGISLTIRLLAQSLKDIEK